jgi:hypothetical protein
MFLSVQKSTDNKKLTEPYLFCKELYEYCQTNSKDYPSVFLVNNSGYSLSKLKTIWGDEDGPNLNSLFYEVFEGKPSKQVFINALLKWHSSRNE